MTEWIVAYEGALRATAFVSTFVLVAIAETLVEARPLRSARGRRWKRNLVLTAINTVIVRLLFPAGATAAAMWAAARDIGLFQQIRLPAGVAMVLAVASLDLAVYGQHRLFHSVPLFFRFHQVHHADVDFDVTLGSRFHPVEMVLSMGIKIAAVVILGASATAVVVFELLLAASSLFTHANVRFPRALDGALRWLVVTPAMHVIHHSADRADRDSNFGFCIPWWDRLFRTYRSSPAVEQPAIGMAEHQATLEQTVSWMLLLPFPWPHARRRRRARAAAAWNSSRLQCGSARSVAAADPR